MSDPAAVRWAREQILRDRHKREEAAADVRAACWSSYSSGYAAAAKQSIDKWLAEYGMPNKNVAIQQAARRALEYIMHERMASVMDQIAAMQDVYERQARYERTQSGQEAFMRAFLDIFTRQFASSFEFGIDRRPLDCLHIIELSLPAATYKVAIYDEEIKKARVKQ
ncbi:hypothetical protein [Zavarzinia aquatilis]|uniref:Uncharacterized protein n=1 Tax=Zavarzinia aquatilis TaxID=2211142 RepID=A0A317ED68_9PROT|nr:hypothetical protein [Zavarzinia aquatilis]PWR24978.1 hypothetical protein DKG74_04205 [Zavarzinia aquatilis]